MSKYDLNNLIQSHAVVSLPTCPSVFLLLVEVLENPDSAGSKLNEVLSSDQALCSQVLRLANSATFGCERQVASIEDAVLRIGYQNIWTMALAIKTKEILEPSSGGWADVNDQMWWHAFKTAIFARFIGKQINPSMASVFFTSGLLHDLGKWIMLKIVPNYLTICDNGRVFGPPLIAMEQANLGTNHANIGGDMINYWRLPELIEKLVRGHHDYAPGTFGVMDAQYVVPMADEMAHFLGDATQDFGADAEVIFPRTMLERSLMSTRAVEMMLAEFQRLRDALNKSRNPG
jgi:HD-like signal output (HDOD) protein